MAKAKETGTEMTVSNSQLEAPPSWVTEGDAGFEGIDQQDLKFPRLAICQALSPERDEDNPLYIPGLKEGDYFNSVSKEVYGPGPLLMTPLLCSKSRLKFKDAKEMGSGIECMGTPIPPTGANIEGIACRLNNGGPCLHQSLDDPDPCYLVYNFPVFLHDHPQAPVVFSFKRTGVKIARGWLTMMKMRGRFPMYAMTFAATTVSASSPKGKYKQARIDNHGWTPQALAAACEAAYESMRGKVVTADDGAREPGEEEDSY